MIWIPTDMVTHYMTAIQQQCFGHGQACLTWAPVKIRGFLSLMKQWTQSYSHGSTCDDFYQMGLVVGNMSGINRVPPLGPGLGLDLY